MSLSSPIDSGLVRTETRWFSWSCRRVLTLLFLFSLPLINPIVHGDGVGYYAYARAPLIQHNLRFEEDWRHGNENFARSRVRPDGQLIEESYTSTGYVSNLFTVGPAMLWFPFLVLAHAFVLGWDALGGHIAADGFSFPYLLAMAAGTAAYGFAGLLLAFSLTRKYVAEKWAFLATVGIWFGSSLPVYMYFNPAWSHAHSAFAVALFLWYWDRTRLERSTVQWVVLGLTGGLMVDVYYPNGVFLVIPLIESCIGYNRLLRTEMRAAGRLFRENVLFLTTIFLTVLPIFLTRKIIFGGYLHFGSYGVLPWNWSAPFAGSVLLSADHGLISWTPLLGLSLLGLLFAPRAARRLALYLAAAALGFYYVIASYPYWDGVSSFGNRFFISLTPVFVFGLALLLSAVAARFASSRRAFVLSAALLACFVLWNIEFIYQWGAHLIPVRGPIVWSEMVHNQFAVVPGEISGQLRTYIFRRYSLMRRIEERDIEQQKSIQP
jgi:hypothetical protein